MGSKQPWKLIGLFTLLLACLLSCNRERPQAAFDRVYKTLLHGDLKKAQDEAHRECQRFQDSNPEWAWRFRTLEARAVLQRGLYEDALKLLQSAPLPSDQPDLAIPILTLEGEADLETHHFSEAERSLSQAAELCTNSASLSCGYVLKARGLLWGEQDQWASAERLYGLTLAFARSHGDALLESHALLNLGNASLAQGRYDEAIDRSEAGYQAAVAVGARRLQLITQGNIGWAYYRLGDYDKALELFLKSEKLASQLGDVWSQSNELTNIGYIYMDERKFDRAGQSFQQALSLAQGMNAKKYIYNALRALAPLSLQTGDLANAGQYAQQALDIARQDGNHLDELYPILVQGQTAARRGDLAAAEGAFHEVERDKMCPVFLKWEAEHSLARLYEDEKQPDSADREYRVALTTFEAARDEVRHEDSQLSFLTNAARIYDDYVHFLVTRGKTDDALRWADYSRARTLAEGLGLLAKGGSSGPPPLDPRQIARRAGGAVLFYWLGEKQSYLWAITPRKTSLFTLPPGAEIDAAVGRYRKALAGPQDVLASADPDGRWLYRTLIAPAEALLTAQPSRTEAHLAAAPKGASDFDALAVSLKRYPDTRPVDTKPVAKVFVIPDGSLNNLNFETLLVSDSKPSEPKLSEAKLSEAKLHYWIEDVRIANASSLRVLNAARADKTKRDRDLLLVGNSVAPNDKYPELPKAASQMESVARHFSAARQRILARQQATPAAYLASRPEQFSYIHFVAHGTASRLSPLDSAIVLSKTALPKAPLSFPLSKTALSEASADSDSFKLYARDIIRHPLRADLVTISACYGAGERAYSGEGLVGLSWAFLRAGAHNVVAALWEATDASTEQLMDKFYDELDKGAEPDAALRAAKLSLLRGGGFHNPFYWAPFQLYAGS
jgi:CHAT domain-containing protein/tetratricopeptide (TPR) repeat protein